MLYISNKQPKKNNKKDRIKASLKKTSEILYSPLPRINVMT